VAYPAQGGFVGIFASGGREANVNRMGEILAQLSECGFYISRLVPHNPAKHFKPKRLI
jgi:hypothetical protein